MYNIKYFYGKPIYKEVRISATHHYSLRLKYMGQIVVSGIYDDESKLLRLGYSRCHPEDNFSKKYGRALAFTRAIESEVFVYCESKEITNELKNYCLALENKLLKDMR